MRAPCDSSSTETVVATTRTATSADEGSFGQGIPAVGEDTVASNGEAIRLFGFADSTAFRTNLGLVNPGSGEVSVVIGFYDGETTKLTEINRTSRARAGSSSIGSSKTSTSPPRPSLWSFARRRRPAVFGLRVGGRRTHR